MDFTASNGAAGGSYEKPKPGTYTGVLIGVADIGTHAGGAYGPKKKILLRWELHKRKGPVLDSAGHILTQQERYNQSFDVKSTLRPIVEAHIGKIKDGETTRSQEWLGKAVKLTLEPSDDEKYINVQSVAPLDTEEDVSPEPSEPLTHWTPADGTAPPSWAKTAWEKSVEFQKTRSNTNGAAVGAGVGGAGVADDDIPF